MQSEVDLWIFKILEKFSIFAGAVISLCAVGSIRELGYYQARSEIGGNCWVEGEVMDFNSYQVRDSVVGVS